MNIYDNDDRKLFLPDDFYRIDNKFFKKIRAAEEIEADPSYWFDSESPIIDNYIPRNIHTYRIDYNLGLKNEKGILINSISNWDNQKYYYNNITVCSSVTTASYIILGFLRDKVNKLIFETPTYFASIVQAKTLGFVTYLIPTYFSNDFQIDVESIESLKKIDEPKAIWLTQPRYGLGINQCYENIIKIVNCLKENDYLIIDEATEQSFPVHLYDINFKKRKNVIKLRSFFKPAGINGPRLSFILHHVDYRNEIQKQLEVVQGAIDCFSLEFTCNILKKEKYFEQLLNMSNKYVVEVRNKIQRYTKGTSIQTIPLENGYIGCVAIRINTKQGYLKERERLLYHCKKMKVPVILGASMYFAIDSEFEFIRINYFNSEYDIFNGIQLISKFI